MLIKVVAVTMAVLFFAAFISSVVNVHKAIREERLQEEKDSGRGVK